MRKHTENIFLNLFGEESDYRQIKIFNFKNVVFTGQNLYYPNIRIKTEKSSFNPIDERIMSLLEVDSLDQKIDDSSNKIISKLENPVFFFIYNTDNYFHFLYDTVPYLISFMKLKETIKDLKLLMNYPVFDKKEFYPFVIELLELLELDKEIIIVEDSKIYSNVFVSTSYTHGLDSNLPPNSHIYSFYKKISEIVLSKYQKNQKYPEKIYISRRS